MRLNDDASPARSEVVLVQVHVDVRRVHRVHTAVVGILAAALGAVGIESADAVLHTLGLGRNRHIEQDLFLVTEVVARLRCDPLHLGRTHVGVVLIVGSRIGGAGVVAIGQETIDDLAAARQQGQGDEQGERLHDWPRETS